MITLFDIPFSGAPNTSWSPNTLKVCLALAIKKLPYKTEWLEYPSIAETLKYHNIKPTGTKLQPDGLATPHYTLPAILDIDDMTGEVKAALAESSDIAEYLDEAYPDSGARLFPQSDKGRPHKKEILEFVKGGKLWIISKPIFEVMRFVILPKLNEASRDHFSRARARDMWDEFHAERLEDIQLSEARKKEMWEAAKACLETLNGQMKGGATGWYLDGKVSFADCAIGALLLFLKAGYGEESDQWKEIQDLSGSQWGRYLEALLAV